jgi:hypothetical protein
MEKLDRIIQQRIHFNRAIAELRCLLEYYTTEREDYEKMAKIIHEFEVKVRTDSPIA